MNKVNIYTLPKPVVFILRDKFDQFAKLKVDFYLNLLNKGKGKYVLAMDHTISFVEEKAVINLTIDIVVFNTSLEPVKYVVIESAPKNSKLFKQVVKHLYTASKFEGSKTLKHLAILNPQNKKLTCIDYKKHNSYKKWQNSGFKYTDCF